MSNFNSFAAWRFEQLVAYAVLILGVAVTFILNNLNPTWAWWFVSVSATISALMGTTMLLFGLTEPINKQFLLLGLVVYFLPALGACCVLPLLN